MIEYPSLPLAQTRQRSDFVLGTFRGQLWIGVRFGETWRPARRAGESDLRYFTK